MCSQCVVHGLQPSANVRDDLLQFTQTHWLWLAFHTTKTFMLSLLCINKRFVCVCVMPFIRPLSFLNESKRNFCINTHTYMHRQAGNRTLTTQRIFFLFIFLWFVNRAINHAATSSSNTSQRSKREGEWRRRRRRRRMRIGKERGEEE